MEVGASGLEVGEPWLGSAGLAVDGHGHVVRSLFRV